MNKRSHNTVVSLLKRSVKEAIEQFGAEREIRVGKNVLELVDAYNMWVFRMEKEHGIELEMIPYEPTIADISLVLNQNHE